MGSDYNCLNHICLQQMISAAVHCHRYFAVGSEIDTVKVLSIWTDRSDPDLTAPMLMNEHSS